MAYHTVQVAVSSKQAKWFKKRRTYPVEVQVNEKTAVYADRLFVLRPLHDGFVAVFRQSATLPLGEFSAETVRHTVSEEAAKDVKVLRAAVLDLAYDAPLALELPDGALVHPGACYRRRPYCVVKKHVHVPDDETRCAVCGESFQ